MYYETTITIPADTLKSAPTEVELRVTQGIIHRIELEFPRGCAALAHVALYYHEHQFSPTNPDGDYASDGYVIPINDLLPLDSAPYTIEIRGWNDDDSYSHTIRVRMGILRPEQLGLGTPRPGILTRLKEALIGE